MEIKIVFFVAQAKMIGWDPQILTLKQLRDWFNTKLEGDIYWMLASRILSNSQGCDSCIFENWWLKYWNPPIWHPIFQEFGGWWNPINSGDG